MGNRAKGRRIGHGILWHRRILIKPPTDEIWNDNGLVTNQWVRSLSASEIVTLLQNDAPIVILNLGFKPHWITGRERFAVWKSDIKIHLATADRVHLEDYPDQYFYPADEWRALDGTAIAVLTMEH